MGHYDECREEDPAMEKISERNKAKKMTTEKIDLVEFKRQKDILTKQAAKDIADKVQHIKILIKEIQTLTELTNLEIRLGQVLQEAIYNVDSKHSEWNSSSWEC